MKTFSDLYVESTTSATFTLGFVGKNGTLLLQQDTGPVQSILFDAATNSATLGGAGAGSGTLSLKNSAGNSTVVLKGAESNIAKPPQGPVPRITVPPPKSGGYIAVRNSGGDDTIVLDGATGDVTIGGGGEAGDLKIRTATGSDTIVLTGSSGSLTVGGGGNNGDISVRDKEGKETMILRGATGSAHLGGGGKDGEVTLKTPSGTNTVVLKASTGLLTLGAVGVNGDIVLKNKKNEDSIVLNGATALLQLGCVGASGDIVVRNSNNIDTITITGSNGDITFLNADVAEEFEVDPDRTEDVIPGAVVVLDECGRLIPCEQPYDSRVAGIVAGAGMYRPGIVLDRNGGMNRRPVALAGKTYCWVDADSHPVRVGDLLTTSGKKGHAMLAADRAKAFGSVIGKALQPLARGAALIPVLVNPQ